jgi:DNA-binding GntR family transcriptional regulator
VNTNSASGSEKLGELAYQTLRRMILDKALRSGRPVVEGRLAEELNISRTPMREALLRLEGEGLLVRAGARSYSVRFVRAEEYFQAMKVRELLEAEAVGLAIGKIDKKVVQQLVKKTKALSSGQQEQAHWQIDDQIHTMMARASGNDVLARTIDVVRTNSRLFELVSPFHRSTVSNKIEPNIWRFSRLIWQMTRRRRVPPSAPICKTCAASCWTGSRKAPIADRWTDSVA